MHDYESFLLEFQIKELLALHNIATPPNRRLAYLLDIEKNKTQIDHPCIIKAQLPVNNRLQYGLIKIISSNNELITASKKILQNIFKYKYPYTLKHFLIEDLIDIPGKEHYICFSVDINQAKIKISVSYYGGKMVEKYSLFCETHVDINTPKSLYECISKISSHLKINNKLKITFKNYIISLFNFFIYYDLRMLEINPFIITKNMDIICLDAKALVDNSALFRQPIITKYRQQNIKILKPLIYKQILTNNINYVPMRGNIACVANGAGLAMSTMDLIYSAGGKIGAFVDIGGGSSTKKITTIFHMLLSNSNINTIVLNIFGGILSCLKITKSILKILQDYNDTTDILIRLNGKDAQKSKTTLSSKHKNIVFENNLTQLIKLATLKKRL